MDLSAAAGLWLVNVAMWLLLLPGVQLLAVLQYS